MSTSHSKHTPIRYMQPAPAPNVLWELRLQNETDAGYHQGASIELLSQYADEEEMLFPPCTMLQVLPAKSANGQPTELSSRQSSADDEAANLPRQRWAQAAHSVREPLDSPTHIRSIMRRYQTAQQQSDGRYFLRVRAVPTFY